MTSPWRLRWELSAVLMGHTAGDNIVGLPKVTRSKLLSGLIDHVIFNSLSQNLEACGFNTTLCEVQCMMSLYTKL